MHNVKLDPLLSFAGNYLQGDSEANKGLVDVV